MKKSMLLVLALTAIVLVACNKSEQAAPTQGHDVEHQHVEANPDHSHDDTHHQAHDHQAHHPEHQEQAPAAQ
jgi:ABC-type nickel/cobalt efflux system permease component RcnA